MNPGESSAETMPTPLAIDWGVGVWPGLEVRALMGIIYAPVVSPRLLAERGPLEVPGDLARFPVIYHHDRGEWQAWLRLAGVPGLPFREEVTVTDSNIVAQAAIDGKQLVGKTDLEQMSVKDAS